MGVPMRTEIVIPSAGALAAQVNFSTFPCVPTWICVAIVSTLGEIVGGSILYVIGYDGDLPFVNRYGNCAMFREHDAPPHSRIHSRYGNVTVLLSRFIPLLRGVSA